MPFYEIVSAETNSKFNKQKKTKKTMNILSQLVMFLSVICFTLGIIEVSKAGKECQNIKNNENISYNQSFLVSSFPKYEIKCYEQQTYGQGIWCSIIPFVTGLFGASFTSKPRKFQKVKCIIFLCVISSAFTQLMTILSVKLLHRRKNYFRITQIIQIWSSEIICVFLTLIASMTQRVKKERDAKIYVNKQSQDHLPSYRELAELGSFTIQPSCIENDETLNEKQNNKACTSKTLQQPPPYLP